MRLLPLLNPVTMAAFNKPPEGFKTRVKEGLFVYIQISGDTYRRRYQAIIRKETNESWIDVLETAGLKWIKDCASPEKVLHLFTMEVMYKMMPGHVHLVGRMRKVIPESSLTSQTPTSITEDQW